MPHITASTARLWISRLFSSSAEGDCAWANASPIRSVNAASTVFLISTSIFSKRIDVVEDRHLPQQYAADDVADLDVFGVDGSRAGRAGREALRERRVVELHAHDERPGLDRLR